MRFITLCAILLSSRILLASTINVNFEGLDDGTVVSGQYSGMVFSNAVILTAGISLNEFEFPPKSGVNVVSDNGGPISIAFPSPVQSFSGYFTYSVPLTIEAFDNVNNLLVSKDSTFTNNEAISGDFGSVADEFLGVNYSSGFSRITITGDPAGGSFVLDDLTVVTGSSGSVPESPTGSLFAFAGILFLLFRHRALFPRPKLSRNAVLILSFLALSFPILSIAAPSVGATTVSPKAIPLNSNVPITITALISDNSLLSQSVSLVQFDSAGGAVQTLGILHDDGLNGDSVAGDNIYTLRTAVPDGTVGAITFKVSAAFRGVLKRSLSAPLSVTIAQNTTLNDTNDKVMLSIPNIGVPSRAVYQHPTGMTPYLDVQYFDSSVFDFVPTFQLIVDPNASGLTLDGWFAENVDQDGMLVDSGAFVQRPIGSSANEYVLVGPLPPAYTQGPVEDGYLMLYGDKRVFIIVSSFENRLYTLGFSSLQIRQMARQILASIANL